MDATTAEYSLLECLGGFHSSLIVALVVTAIFASIFSCWRRERSGLLHSDASLLLYFGIAVFFWGQASSDWEATSYHAMLTFGGSFDPSIAEDHFTRVAAIKSLYSGVAVLSVVLMIVVRIAGKTESNKPRHSSPDRTESK